MDYRSKEAIRHWTPRLLGITPLMVFCLGLLAQGGPWRGLLMVLTLLLIITALLILYKGISHLADQRGKPRNPLLHWLYTPLVKLIGPGSRERQSWPLQMLQSFLRAITASPYSGLASLVEDLEFRSDGSSIKLDIEEKLNPRMGDASSADPAISASARSKGWKLLEINGQQMPAGQKKLSIKVDGGTIAWQDRGKNLPCIIVFNPDQNCEGRCFFMCRASSLEEDLSFPVTVAIKRAAANSEPGARPTISSAWKLSEQFLLTRGREWISSLRWVLHYLLQLRIQIAIALLCCFLFQLQQVHDVLLAMVLDHETRHFVWATFFATILSLLLWHSTRQLTRLFPEILLLRKGRGTKKMSASDKPAKQARGKHLGSEINQGIFSQRFELMLFWLSWISIALFTVPIAREALEFANGRAWQFEILKAFLLFAIWATCIFLWHYPAQQTATKKRSYTRTFSLLLIAGIALPLLFQFFPANALPGYFGSLAVLFWALCMFLVVMTTLFRFSVASGFPLLSLLLALAYILNINRLNDNHAIRQRSTVSSEANAYRQFISKNHKLPSIDTAFDAWLESRQDLLQAYAEKKLPFPVYVISAQGGGIYAAYHTAKALARLSEEIPGFEDHVFAISGVSGGSIGSTIYAMALRSHADSCHSTSALKPKRASLTQRIDHYFEERDALATILASMLFGDVTQRFFPIPLGHWDRSVGLELGFENSNASSTTTSIGGQETCFEPIKLDGSFYFDQDVRLRRRLETIAPRSVKVKNQTAAKSLTNLEKIPPFLVLNTTEVENGRRYILAPFSMSEAFTDADFHQPWLQNPNKPFMEDLRFSTAAGISARFPIVSPYGFFHESRRRRFVDGGLYDNSGAITAKEIINSLNSHPSNLNTKKCQSTPSPAICRMIGREGVRLIPIAIVDKKAVELNSEYANPDLNSGARFRMIGWSPIKAVLSTREARLQKASDELIKSPSSNSNNESAPVEHRILLQKDFRLGDDAKLVFSVPLGWKISCQARAFINDQIQPQGFGEDGFRPVPIPCETRQQLARRAVIASHSQRDRKDQCFADLIAQLKRDLGNTPTTTRRDCGSITGSSSSSGR
jgi:hypothetical protein